MSKKPGGLTLRTQPVRMAEQPALIEIRTTKTQEKVYESKMYGKPVPVFSKFLDAYKETQDGGDFYQEFNSQTSYRLLSDEDKKEAAQSAFVYKYLFYVELKIISFYWNNQVADPLTVPLRTEAEKKELLSSLKELYALGFEVNGISEQSFRLKYLLKL